MPSTMLVVLYAVHLLAAVIWIGGLLMIALVVKPGARRVWGETPTIKTSARNAVEALLTELGRRFTPLANLSLVVLIVTGMFQMSADPNYDGLLQFNSPWAWAMLFKHLAVIGMALNGIDCGLRGSGARTGTPSSAAAGFGQAPGRRGQSAAGAP